MPTASSQAGMQKIYSFFCFTLWFAGIDSAFCYVESMVTNMLDLLNENKWVGSSIAKGALCAALVCMFGIAITGAFTTNFGWVPFDMVEHYIADYLIVPVGLLQCVCVGW
jgi:SNF family Na+-dependent transporter